jgi:hypothetical protein
MSLSHFINLRWRSDALGQLRPISPTRAMSAIPPIVLQKSFCTDDQKFCGLQARFSCKDVSGPVAPR